jgi:3-deoxy-D-manno-octulosonate 8-phosphate phosphatase (KDO 8-P phosphatase)
MRMVDVARIRLIVTDVDGVLTDGKIIYIGDNRETKEFHVRDGLAIKLAQKSGIAVAVVSSRKSGALERRCRELGISEIRQGAVSKAEETQKLAAALGMAFDEICYVGDDLPDLAPMMAAGISAAPADAVAEVRRAATWKLETRGGEGALRELVERLLRERGDWAAIVREFESGRPEAQSV